MTWLILHPNPIFFSVAAGRKSSSAGAKETESAGTNGLPPAPEAEALAPYDELADELQRVTVSEQKEREAAVSLFEMRRGFYGSAERFDIAL